MIDLPLLPLNFSLSHYLTQEDEKRQSAGKKKGGKKKREREKRGKKNGGENSTFLSSHSPSKSLSYRGREGRKKKEEETGNGGRDT